MDRARAGPTLTSSYFAGTRLPRLDVTGSDIHDGVDVEVNKGYAEVGYRSSAVAASVRLAWIAAREVTWRAAGCDWDILDVTDFAVQSKYLDSSRFGIFSTEEQVRRVVLNGISRVMVYGAWNMRIAPWEIPAVHRVQVQLDIPLYRDWCELNFVMMLDNRIRNYNDGRTSRPGMLLYCLLDTPYDCLPFMS